MKFAHKLSSNKTTALPTNFIFVDTETRFELVLKTNYHFLKLGCAEFVTVRDHASQNTIKKLTFRANDEFWDRVESFCRSKSKTLLYAHNQHFDFFVLDGINNLVKRKWSLKSFFINCNVFIMTWVKEGKKLMILDSTNIVKKSLASVGEAVGYPKLKIDFSKCDALELEIYCQRDVEILREWVLAFRTFVKEHDLGTFKHTIASQAFTAFKHRFMHQDIFIHNNKSVIQLERDAYFGGRTEAFYIGKISGQRFTLVDVNSMYPYVMKKYSFPTKLIKHAYKPRRIEWYKDLCHYSMIARVGITTRKNAFPFRGKRTVFPIGCFETTLCTPELRYALKHKMIKGIKEMAVYESQPIFKDYVNFFYGLKKDYKVQKDHARYSMTKLFLNSLYGKFGQRSFERKLVDYCDENINKILSCYDSDEDEAFTMYMIAGKIWEEKKAGNSFDSFVAIAAHVTAYARKYLFELMEAAGQDNVFYMDTDSLLVNDNGLRRLKEYFHPTKLGLLDVEYKTRSIEIRGAKDYTFGSRTKIKGIKKNAKKVAENEYIQDQFLKFNSLLRRSVTNRAAHREVIKKLARIYTKGRVLSSGRVKPYVFPDDERFLNSS